MWTFKYTLSQIFVIIAVCCYITTFFTKNRKTILIFSSLNCLFYALQYMLLGSQTGLILNILSILRAIWFFINNEKGKNKDYLSLIVCSVVLTVAGLLTTNHPMDLIPVFNVLIYTYIIWQKNIKVYRICGLLISFSWICYSIYLKSIFAILADVLTITITFVSIVNMFLKEKNSKKQNDTQNT